MRIPSEREMKKWQPFITGLIIGAIIAYTLFIFMNGQLYEQLLTESYELQAELSELEKQYELLEQDKEDLDERASKAITIEKINVEITNEKELRLDRLMSHQMVEQIKTDIEHLLGQDITVVEQSAQLLITTIENKPLTIDEVTYHFSVEQLVISAHLKLNIKAEIAKESLSQP